MDLKLTKTDNKWYIDEPSEELLDVFRQLPVWKERVGNGYVCYGCREKTKTL